MFCLQGVGREEREEVTRPSGLAAPAASPTVFQEEEEVSGCDVAVALLKVKDGVLGRVILISLGPLTLEKSRDNLLKHIEVSCGIRFCLALFSWNIFTVYIFVYNYYI